MDASSSRQRSVSDDGAEALGRLGTIGRYTLHRQLGEGGMGQVWLAHARHAHADLDDDLEVYPVVVKFARLAKLFDDQVRKGLLTEGAVMALLNCGNVPKIYEVGEFEGLSYVAMEYVPGVSLTELCRLMQRAHRPMSFENVATIGYVLAQTLRQVHNAMAGAKPLNLVHRDVSAKNVLVSGSGRVVLLDFGIVAGAVATSHHGAKGTPHTMAPEQYHGEITPAVDAYGLGTILWTLLEGVPFRAEFSEPDLYGMIARGIYSPLTRSGIPPVMRAVCDRLLEPDPCKRMLIDEVIASFERNFSRRVSELELFISDLVGTRARRSGVTMDQPILTDGLAQTRRAAMATVLPSELKQGATFSPLARDPMATKDAHVPGGPNGTSRVQSWCLQRAEVVESAGLGDAPVALERVESGATTHRRLPADELDALPPAHAPRTDVLPSAHMPSAEALPAAHAPWTDGLPPAHAHWTDVLPSAPAPWTDDRLPQALPSIESRQPEPVPESDALQPRHPVATVRSPAPEIPDAATEVRDMAPAAARLQAPSGGPWLRSTALALATAALVVVAFVSMDLARRSPASAAPHAPAPSSTSASGTETRGTSTSNTPAPSDSRDVPKSEVRAASEPAPARDPGEALRAELGETAELAGGAAKPPPPSDPEGTGPSPPAVSEAPRPRKIKRPTAPLPLVQVDVKRHPLTASAEVKIGEKYVDLRNSHHVRIMLPIGTHRVRWRASETGRYEAADPFQLENHHVYRVYVHQSGVHISRRMTPEHPAIVSSRAGL